MKHLSLAVVALGAMGLAGCVAYPAGPGVYDYEPAYAPGPYYAPDYYYGPAYVGGSVVYYDHGHRYYGPPRGYHEAYHHDDYHHDEGHHDNDYHHDDWHHDDWHHDDGHHH